MGTRWHHSRQYKSDGPVDSTELHRLAKIGVLLPSDSVRRSGSRRWVVAARIEGLFNADEPKWYYMRDGEPVGPVTIRRLWKLARSGELRADDLVWKPGLSRWRVATRFIHSLRTQDDGPRQSGRKTGPKRDARSLTERPATACPTIILSEPGRPAASRASAWLFGSTLVVLWSSLLLILARWWHAP